ncbi:MAG: stage II sporulation protein R, partial [Acutalibacteraceae bacterium]
YESRIDEINNMAQQYVYEAGYDYETRTEVLRMDFDDREYGDITMPQGNYRAVRITIGEAEGHNWWCVMFPPLCISAASDNEAQLDDVLTDEQMEFVQGTQYEARFKCVEWYEEIKQYFDFK